MQGVGVWLARFGLLAVLLWAVAGLASADPELQISAEVLAATEVADLEPDRATTTTTAGPTSTRADGAPTSAALIATSTLAPATTQDATASSTTPTTAAVTSTTAAPASTTTITATTTSAAPATTTTTVAAAPRLTRAELGAQALARMRFDIAGRFPGWEVDFGGPRSGLRALTYPAERRIVVFVRDSDTVASLHRVVAHEFGHVADLELLTPAEREEWRRHRGIGEQTPWWPGEAAPDFATGAGDVAEAFAVWETGVRSQSQVAGQPDAADLELLMRLLG